MVLILLLNSFVYASCSDDIQTLEKYYEASKNEDYDKYISLMDTDYIYEYLAEEEYYRYYVEAAWEVYNTIDYELDIIKCNEVPEGSIIFLEVDSKIESEGETFDIARIYAAVLENGKIQFVMDYDTFAYHQNLAYTAMYFNDTRDIMEDTLDEAEKIIEYYETFEMPKEKKGFSWLWVIFFVLLMGTGVFYREKVVFAAKHSKNMSKPFLKNFFKNTKKFYVEKLKPFLKNFFKNLNKFYNNKIKPFLKKMFHIIKTKLIPETKKIIIKIKDYVCYFYKHTFIPFVKKTKKKVSKLYNDKLKK